MNRLCVKLDGMWRISAEEFENALSENDVHGALNIDAAYERLREEMSQSNDLSM